MSYWRSAEREPRGEASATARGRAPAVSRAWGGSAPKPILAAAATIWCAGTAAPIVPTVPGAAKSAPRRRKFGSLSLPVLLPVLVLPLPCLFQLRLFIVSEPTCLNPVFDVQLRTSFLFKGKHARF